MRAARPAVAEGAALFRPTGRPTVNAIRAKMVVRRTGSETQGKMAETDARSCNSIRCGCPISVQVQYAPAAQASRRSVGRSNGDAVIWNTCLSRPSVGCQRLTEAISALIIAIGVVHAAVLIPTLAFPAARRDVVRRLDLRENIRLKLGRWLALALEFQLAADILKTAVAPTWDDIGKVAAIIALRTLLNFFLEREIGNAERQRTAGA